MKRQKNITAICFWLVAASLLIGCVKEDTTNVVTTTNESSQTTIASDEVTLNNEFDQAADEAIQVICNHNATIKGASIDTSQITMGIITIYYGGKEADGTKTRTGSDSIHLNGNWGTPGAFADITLGCINAPGYEVQFTSLNNVSLRFNGTAKLTNINGGLFQNITPGDSLVEAMKGSLTYTFNDNAATIVYYPFNLYEVRTIINSGSVLNAYTRGDTVIGGFSHVSSWGGDRFGNTYYSSTTTVVMQNISTASLSYNPLSGAKYIQFIGEPILCTFGVNSSGSVVTSGTPYGFYINWTNNGGGAQAVIPYYY